MKRNSAKKSLAAVLSVAVISSLITFGGNVAQADSPNSSEYAVSNVSSLAKVSGVKTAVRSEDEIGLSWNYVQGASGYEIAKYSFNRGAWVTVEYEDDTHGEVDDLSSGTIYKFRVRAFSKNSNGNIVYGPWSKTFSTVTSPNEVSNLRSDKTDTSVTLKWNAVKNATKYQVYQNTSNGWKRLATTSATSYKVDGLTKGSTYRFKVRAVREALGSRYYGDFEYLTASTGGSSVNPNVTNPTAEQAKKIALDKAGLTASQIYDYEIELDYEGGVKVYEISFSSGMYEYEVIVNASTGKVEHFSKEYDD